MNHEQREAYLRTLLALQAKQTRGDTTTEADATASQTVVAPADVRIWATFALDICCCGGGSNDRSMIDAEADTSQHESRAQQCQKWTRLLGCLAETELAASTSEPSLWLASFRIMLPLARSFLKTDAFSQLEFLLTPAPLQLQETHSQASSSEDVASGGRQMSLQCAVAVAKASAAMHTDVLQIGWDLVNPKVTPLIAMRRLEALGPLLVQRRSIGFTDATNSATEVVLLSVDSTSLAVGTDDERRAKLDAADPNPEKGTLIHPRCLEPLLTALSATHSDSNGNSKVDGDTQRILTRFLVRLAYDMVTKLDAGFVESGYYALPFIVDFAACCSYTTAAATENSEAILHAELHRAQAAVRAGLANVYTAQLAGCLADHRKTMFQPKLFVGVPQSSVTLSRAAFEALHRIVEPSMNVLRRYCETGACRSSAASVAAAISLRAMLAGIMKEAWAEVAAVEGKKDSVKTAARVKEDVDILLTYMKY